MRSGQAASTDSIVVQRSYIDSQATGTLTPEERDGMWVLFVRCCIRCDQVAEVAILPSLSTPRVCARAFALALGRARIYTQGACRFDHWEVQTNRRFSVFFGFFAV